MNTIQTLKVMKSSLDLNFTESLAIERAIELADRVAEWRKASVMGDEAEASVQLKMVAAKVKQMEEPL